MSMLQILNEIEATKGKEKVALMQSNMSDTLKIAFRYAYSPKLVFGIKDFSIPESTGDYPLTALALEVALQLIIDSNTPTESVPHVLSKFNPDNQEVIARIIRKDLRIGASASSFNKAVGEQYVYQHPYNRCSSLSEKSAKKIKFPCISQVKSDGKFADLMIEPVAPVHDGLEQPRVRFCNRDGVTMPILPQSTLDKLTEVTNNYSQGFAISGELLYLDEEGKVLPRAIGNGILNSDEIDENRVLFRVWDARLVDYDGDKYDGRLDFLAWLVDGLSKVMNIEITPTIICQNWDDIGAHYKECRLAGEEGTIVKNTDFQFKDGTSPECIKLKAIIEGEVIVTGVTEGDKKWAGVGVGALVVESSCGMMKCSCAGLTDKQRIDYYNNPELIVGKVIRVLYNGVVQREGEEQMALYLPRFDEVRDDKTEADSLERLLEQEKASIDILIKWG